MIFIFHYPIRFKYPMVFCFPVAYKKIMKLRYFPHSNFELYYLTKFHRLTVAKLVLSFIFVICCLSSGGNQIKGTKDILAPYPAGFSFFVANIIFFNYCTYFTWQKVIFRIFIKPLPLCPISFSPNSLF